MGLYTLAIILFSAGVFYWFGRFTLRLIRQHQDVYGLLFELEEEDEK